MNKLQQIFDKIEGREWDKFDLPAPCDLVPNTNGVICYGCMTFRSIADLLSNRSWCEAVWGEMQPLTTNDSEPWNGQECLHCRTSPAYQTTKEIFEKTECNHVQYPDACKVCNRKTKGWEHFSKKAFQILQNEVPEACLDYILTTMK